MIYLEILYTYVKRAYTLSTFLISFSFNKKFADILRCAVVAFQTLHFQIMAIQAKKLSCAHFTNIPHISQNRCTVHSNKLLPSPNEKKTNMFLMKQFVHRQGFRQVVEGCSTPLLKAWKFALPSKITYKLSLFAWCSKTHWYRKVHLWKSTLLNDIFHLL